MRSEFVTIFSTFGFTRAWWSAYGARKELRVVVTEESPGRPSLIAPFYAEASDPDSWTLIGNVRADYNNLIFEKGDTACLSCLASWLRRNRCWKTIRLENVPDSAAVLSRLGSVYEPDSDTLKKLRCWLSVWRPLVYREWRSVHPRIDGPKLGALGKLIDERNHRKHLNWFQRQGAVAYACFSHAPDISARLGAYMDQHVAEWTAKGQSSVFQVGENRRFYEHLIEELAPYDALRLDWLTLNEKPVAAHLGFTWRDKLYYYKPCYDPAFGNHSPGKLLLAYILRRALDSGVNEVDLLYGLEEYKMKYASDVRRTGSLFVQRSPLHAFRRRIARKSSSAQNAHAV